MASHPNYKQAVPTLHTASGVIDFSLGTAGDANALPSGFFATDEGELLSEFETEVMRRFLTALVDEGSLLLIAKNGDDIVGMSYIDIVTRQRPHSVIKTSQPAGIIERVRSLVEHQGIGRALLDNAEGLIEQAGLLVAEVGVTAKNLRARRIYERAGYVARLTDAEERLPDFEGYPIYRYWRPNTILFKELY